MVGRWTMVAALLVAACGKDEHAARAPRRVESEPTASAPTRARAATARDAATAKAWCHHCIGTENGRPCFDPNSTGAYFPRALCCEPWSRVEAVPDMCSEPPID